MTDSFKIEKEMVEKSAEWNPSHLSRNDNSFFFQKYGVKPGKLTCSDFSRNELAFSLRNQYFKVYMFRCFAGHNLINLIITYLPITY